MCEIGFIQPTVMTPMTQNNKTTQRTVLKIYQNITTAILNNQASKNKHP